MNQFQNYIIEFVEEKTEKKGRYAFAGIRLNQVKDLFKLIPDKVDISIEDQNYSFPYIHQSERKFLFASQVVDNNLTEKSCAIGIRNTPAKPMFSESDYCFFSENPIELASLDNTISVFPDNYDNVNNNFFRFVRGKFPSEKGKATSYVAGRDKRTYGLVHHDIAKFYEKLEELCNDSKALKTEIILGLAKGQLSDASEITKDNDIAKKFLDIYIKLSSSEGLTKCLNRFENCIKAQNYSATEGTNILDTLKAFHLYFIGLSRLNRLTYDDIKNIPNYYYSPISALIDETKQIYPLQLEWEKHFNYFTFEVLTNLVDCINGKSKDTSLDISIVNKLGAKNFFPKSKIFNYTHKNSEFKSSSSDLDSITIDANPSIAITPPSKLHTHTSGLVSIEKSIKFEFTSGTQKANIKLIELDNFPPGVAIGLNNTKPTSESYPKRINSTNHWHAKFNLQKNVVDKVVVYKNSRTTIIDIYKIRFSSDNVDGLTQDEIFENICGRKNIQEDSFTSLNEFSSKEDHVIYSNPFDFLDEDHSYFLCVKTRSIDSNKAPIDHCIISELIASESTPKDVSTYYEKYLLESISTDKLKIKSTENLNFLNILEEYISGNHKSCQPIIFCYNKGIRSSDFEKMIANKSNIANNILASFEVADNYQDKRIEINPPHAFIEKRTEFFKNLNAIVGDGLIENSCDFMAEDFKDSVLEYVNSYLNWLKDSPEEAIWMDLILMNEQIEERPELQSESDAIIMLPHHPLRLMLQLESQSAFHNSGKAPGNTLIDLSQFPSTVTLNLFTNNTLDFFSVDHNNDYSSFLLNEKHFTKSGKFLSDYKELLNSVDGFDLEFFYSTNFITEKDVFKSIEDVSNIYISKNIIKIRASDHDSVSKSGFTNGVFNWIDKYKIAIQKEDGNIFDELHSDTTLKVFDERTNQDEKPNYNELRGFSNKTVDTLEWITESKEKSLSNDLNIICNIANDELKIENCEQEHKIYNPAFHVYRSKNKDAYSVQLNPNNYRGIIIAEETDTPLGQLLFKFEYSSKSNTVKRFDTRTAIQSLHDDITHNSFTAVSGLNLDPSNLISLGKDTLLYNFNTVGYGKEKNAYGKYGYFLIANDKGFIQSSIKAAISRNFNNNLNPNTLTPLIRAISVNGVSNLKSIYAGGNATRGEIGVYIAHKIITDCFQHKSLSSFIVPVDPFQPKLNEIQKALGKTQIRPDFLVVTVCKSSMKIKISPVEVKFRAHESSLDKAKALKQAANFSDVLSELISKEATMWKITAIDFIIMLLEYGYNHTIISYSDQSQKDEAETLNREKNNVINKLFSMAYKNKITSMIEVDKIGRLVVISPSISNVEFENIGTKSLKFNTLLVNEKYAMKCLNGEPVSEIMNEYSNVSQTNGNFFHLNASCQNSVENIDVKDITSEVSEIIFEDLNTDLEIDEKNKLPQTIIENENIHGASDDDVADKEVVETAPMISNDEVNVHSDPINFNPNDISGIEIPLGSALNLTDQTDYLFTPSDTQLNQLNIGVVGDLGTGKTQFLKNFIYKISLAHNENRGEAPKFLIFDTKKDYDLTNNSKIDKILHKKANIRTFSPSFLPINIFDLSNVVGANKAHVRAKFISNIFNKIFRIGIVQESKLTKIISDCYRSKGYKPGMSIEDITGLETPNFNEIHDLYDKDDSVKAILFDIVESYIFESDKTKIMSFKDLFQQSLVFSLGDLVENQRELVMIVLLVLYREYMIGIKKEPFIESPKNGKTLRKVDSFVLIDEANQIMDYEFDVLEDILLKGREFGVGVILSTQYLSHFKKSNMNYAESLNTWFVHKQNKLNKRDLLDIGLQNADENRISKIKRLRVFECLYKSLNSDDGVFIKGIPFFENFE